MTKRSAITMLGLFLIVALLASLAHASGIGNTTQPIAPQRSYLCFEGATAGEVMKKANQAGAQGWRMASATSARGTGIWCFEQLSSARPQSRTK